MITAPCMNLPCANKKKNRGSRPRERERDREREREKKKVLTTTVSSMGKFAHCRLRISRAKFLRAFIYNVSDEVCECLDVSDCTGYHLYDAIII